MKKVLKIAGIILAVFIVIGLLAGSGGEKQSNTSPTTETEVSQKSKEATKEYQPVFTFKGNGAKKSEPFTITGDRFKIKYNCTGDLCQAFLQKPDSEIMSDLIMNTTGSVKDESIFYGSGEYYIDSNSLGNYEMIVEDYK